MYRKILVPIEVGSMDRGERALRKAAALLDEGGEIVLLNVVEDVPAYVRVDLPVELIENALEDGRRKLEALSLKTGIPTIAEVQRGPPANGILTAAGEHGADLIIIASHIPDLSNYFIGATADRVVRHAKCSVLVERG
jgi:universal stress protein F